MKAKEYPILVRAVEEGYEYGFSRAHKHTETPTEFQRRSEIIDAIVSQICDVFSFDDEVNNG